MDDINKLSPGQIADLMKRLKSKPISTKYGTGYNGRPLMRYAGLASSSARDRSEPIIRGQLTHLLDWQAVGWLPGFEMRPALIEIQCPFCDEIHQHSWPETFLTGRYMGHRDPHCSDHRGKPGRSDFYWIAPFRRKDLGYSLHIFKPGTVFFRRAVG